MGAPKNLTHLTWAEGWRKLAHLAAFWPAFLLPWLTPGQAILIAFALVLMNVFILPRLGKILYRTEEPGLGALEIVLYPFAVMACAAAFGWVGEATGNPPWYIPFAATWFALACIDPIIGIACRLLPIGPTLPWNSRKPVLAICLGALTACLPTWLLAHWVLPPHSPMGWTWLFAMVCFCALVETAWFGIADNLVIPFSLCVIIPFIPSPLFAEVGVFDMGLGPNWALILVPLAFGIAAFTARLLTVSGSILGGLLALVLMLANPWLFAFLGGFFILGNLATRFGLQRKQGLGIAEARGGKRGAAEVFGAMGMAAWMTPLVHLTRSESEGVAHAALLVCIAPLVAKTMDTVSSEIGKAMTGKTFSPLSLRAVPPGSQGGVSLGGTLWGLVAAVALGLPILLLGWGNWVDVLILIGIALIANLFESYWGEWAAPRGMDQGAHTNVLMTMVAAILAWIAWIGIR